MILGRLGIGARLFIAFLAITAVSLSSGVTSWFILQEISQAQRQVNVEALPAISATTRAADATSRLVATAAALDGAADEQSRAKVEIELAALATEVRGSVSDASFSSLDEATVSSLARTVDALISNLSKQNALVKERLELSGDFIRRADNSIAAATAIVDVSETLVSNASASASAVVASLYGLIDDPGLHGAAYDALDRLIEQDIYLLDRMSELRLRSSQIGLLTNRLTRAIDVKEVNEITNGYLQHLRVVHRRIASIDDPVRKLQAQGYEDVLTASVGNTPWEQSLFAQRLRLIEIGTELEGLSADNRNLSAKVGEIARSMLHQAEGFARSTADRATAAANAGLYGLVVSTLIAILISGLIVWLYVERKVVRRLANLAGAMQRLTDGDLTVDVKEEGTHELRALSGAVRAFRDESKQRLLLEGEKERTNEELRRHRQELKALVDERTAQLSDANDKLQREVVSHAEARRHAESANRTKSEFLATMSHEIRTPMTGMMGMLRVLSGSDVTREQQHQLSVARQSGEALLAILNSILDYSKIEAGKITVDLMPFSLREALDGIIALMQPAAQEKGLSIRLDVDAQVWRSHLCDGGKVRQVMFNLLSNAIKFTDRGEILIAVRVLSQQAKQQEIALSVTDHGIGIADDQQVKIFESFTQTDPSVTRQYGGTGLGLAISRHLVEIMGGRLLVASVLGQGSTFTAHLPLQAAPTRQISKRKAAGQTGSRPVNVSVLVVEDDPATRIVVQTFLEAAGHRVILAEDGPKAIKLAQTQPIDVVLMDIGLPGMDGQQVTQALRKSVLSQKVPVIAMSAHVFQSEVDGFLQSGMDGYVGKPLSPEALLSAIEAALVAKGGRPKSGTARVDVAFPDLGSHGPEIASAILDAAEAAIPPRFKQMRACLDRMDFKQIEGLAHATCSSASSAGFEKLLANARSLEQAAKTGDMDATTRHLASAQRSYKSALAKARLYVAKASNDIISGSPQTDSLHHVRSG
jgi:two-component system, OmpR family, sensor histidine kinase TorS